MEKCDGEHELYVAETFAVESEGKVCIVTVCRHCDRVSFHEHVLTKQHSPITSTKDKGQHK